MSLAVDEFTDVATAIAEDVGPIAKFLVSNPATLVNFLVGICENSVTIPLIIFPFTREDAAIGVSISTHAVTDIIRELTLKAFAICKVVNAFTVGRIVSKVTAEDSAVGELQYALAVPCAIVHFSRVASVGVVQLLAHL